jgi:type III secretion protein R
MNAPSGNLLGMVALVGALGIMPFAIVCTTSYAKIAIVFMIIRNALGIQQMPPTILLNGMALILTLFIMSPVIREGYAIASSPSTRVETVQDWERTATQVSQPLTKFMDKFTDPKTLAFFQDATEKLWGVQGKAQAGALENFTLKLPAFMVSELTRAFEIGFLLYLPFLAVDFAVSAILLAMGMQMMSPPVISTPLKLLLFVAVDGWSRLIQGLILSYAVPS